jgi:hypothetical protein
MIIDGVDATTAVGNWFEVALPFDLSPANLIFFVDIPKKKNYKE